MIVRVEFFKFFRLGSSNNKKIIGSETSRDIFQLEPHASIADVVFIFKSSNILLLFIQM